MILNIEFSILLPQPPKFWGYKISLLYQYMLSYTLINIICILIFFFLKRMEEAVWVNMLKALYVLVRNCP